MTFDDILEQVITLLRRQGRLSYRALKVRFDIDGEYLEALKEEVIEARRLAEDENGRILVWTGGVGDTSVSAFQPDKTTKPAVQEKPPMQVESPPTEPHTLEAERRQLTILFTDLVDSTQLSGQLDAEEYRELVRAYQAVCAEVIQRYDCHLAQTLGDGLLIYSGYPVAHENDAERAVRVGGLVMTFKEVLAAVIDWLQQDKRLSYRALKRQFGLDDEYLEDVKLEIINVRQLAVDHDGKMLVWAGEAGSPEPNARRGTEDERRFQALLPAVMALLRQEGRVTYRTLKWTFGVCDALLEEIRKELSFRQVARDELGEGLVWIGEPHPVMFPMADVPSRPVMEDTTAVTSPPITAPSMPSNGPTAPPETIAINVPQDESIISSEPMRSAFEAEHRQLTVMFCDLADSTKLSQQLDPEDLREVIRAYQHTSAELIQRFDGYIAQHLGDGLLIYFGWPRAHEDDAQRSLYAGLDIVEAITTNLNPRLQREHGVALTVRLGVHTGPVVVGEMGGGDRLENLATGETVNIAARLEGVAQPNTVVISPTTARLVEGLFDLADMGTHTLKGVADPMQVFRVLSPAEAHRDDDEGLPDSNVFLVGRGEEIGLLLRRWEQAKEGLGQVVLVNGEAGIGKSSLVATMRQRVMEEGHTRITFRCSPYHTNSALYPVITHLEQMLGFDRDDTPGTRLDKLVQVLRTTSLPEDESVPLLATLLSVPVGDRYPALTLSPQQQRQQTLDTLVAWLMEESEKQPVLAIWEDLHWADPSTLDMLGLVLEQTPTVPMLNVLTFRPEFESPWPTRSHMTPLTLNRLERPQVEALITHLADGKVLPVEVVEHIVSKTDGVPLYVEELTKMLLASTVLREEMDQYVLTGPLTTVAIPDTLQGSLMARLDQMHTAKETAQLGAVIGREFTYEMLEAITPQDDETLQASLAQLVEAELLYQRGRPPRAWYVFKHALIQDAAYASLLRSTRQGYHRRVAEVLTERFPETAEAQPELLAYHYTEANVYEQGVRYWHQAGQRAREHSAYTEEIGHLSKGLRVLQALPDTSTRLQHELALQTSLSQALMFTKGYAAIEVLQAYQRARDLSQKVGDRSQLLRILRGVEMHHSLRGEFPAAHEIAAQILDLAHNLQDPVHLITAHYVLGQLLNNQGRWAEAQAHLAQVVTLYDPAQHQQQLVALYAFDSGATASAYLGRGLWPLGYADQAIQKSREAIHAVQLKSNPFPLVNAAYVHLCRGEAYLAQEMAEEAIRVSTDGGFAYWLALGMIKRGAALVMQEQCAEGLAQLQQGLSAMRANGAAGRQHHVAMLAKAYSKCNQIEMALRLLNEAISRIPMSEEYAWEAELHRLKGEFLFIRNGVSQTASLTPEDSFRQALDIACQQHAKSWELRAATSLARLWQSQDKRKEAYDLLVPVYGWFTEGFDTLDLQEAKALLDELA